MTEQSFSLIPFAAPDLPAISISGKISFEQNVLAVHYVVTGDLQQTLIPAPSPHPTRQNELWMGTCFECFLAVEDQPAYWELNFSPSGDWNAYRMEAYRRAGFRQESLIQQVQIETRREDGHNEGDSLFLHAAVDLSPLVQKDDLLQAGLTAIIQTRNGSETYWALSHPAPQADFHVRESFILRLEGQTRLSAQSAPGG